MLSIARFHVQSKNDGGKLLAFYFIRLELMQFKPSFSKRDFGMVLSKLQIPNLTSLLNLNLKS